MQTTDPDSVEPIAEGEEAAAGNVEEAAGLLVSDRERAIPPDDLFARMKPIEEPSGDE